jgi:hypothetical protein
MGVKTKLHLLTASFTGNTPSVFVVYAHAASTRALACLLIRFRQTDVNTRGTMIPKSSDLQTLRNMTEQ